MCLYLTGVPGVEFAVKEGVEQDFGFSRSAAYMLLGSIAEARCTQMVNPKFTYICKVRKALLPRRK